MDIDERPHYDATGVRLGAVGTTESNGLVANGNLLQVRGVYEYLGQIEVGAGVVAAEREGKVMEAT